MWIWSRIPTRTTPGVHRELWSVVLILISYVGDKQ
jgi:hypothetical protein